MNNLQDKQTTLDALVRTMALFRDRIVSTEDKQEMDNIELRLQFRLKQLVEECKLRELDHKIDALQSIINLLKHETIIKN